MNASRFALVEQHLYFRRSIHGTHLHWRRDHRDPSQHNLPTPAHAQGGIPLGTPVPAGRMSGMHATMTERAKQRFLSASIRVTPGTAAVDTNGAVTLTLSNPSTDTVTATLTAGLVGPATILDSAGAPDITSFLDGAPADTPPPVDSIAASASLATWVHDLPDHVTLMPGATQTIVVHVVPPKTAKPGDYAAWIMATTDFKALNKHYLPKTKKLGRVTMTVTSNMPKWSAKQLDRFEHTLQSGCKITYHIPGA
jgi:hypothetical protein